MQVLEMIEKDNAAAKAGFDKLVATDLPAFNKTMAGKVPALGDVKQLAVPARRCRVFRTCFGIVRHSVATFSIVTLIALLTAAPAEPQDATRAAGGRLRQISSVDGKDLYIAYCAQCHGREGKGDGPRARDLAKPVPDLTRIAARNGGRFNRTQLEGFIAGESRPGVSRLDTKTGRVVITTDEGADPMPDWRFLFRAMWPDQPVQIRIGNIVRYLEKIQVRD